MLKDIFLNFKKIVSSNRAKNIGLIFLLLMLLVSPWLFLGYLSLIINILFVIAVLIYASYKYDITIPIIGSVLNRLYFKVKFKISEIQNEKKIAGKIKINSCKMVLSVLRYAILLFKSSADSFEALKEEWQKSHGRSIYVKHKFENSSKSEKVTVEKYAEKLKQGEKVDEKIIKKLDDLFYKLHNKKQKQVSVFSMVGLSIIIAGSVAVGMITSFIFPHIFSSKAATFNWTQTNWAGGRDGGAFPDHTDNQSNWTQYSTEDNGIATSTDLTLKTTIASASIDFTTEGNYTQEDATDGTDFSAGSAILHLNNGVMATGGTIAISDGYKIHTFTSSGIFEVEAIYGSGNVDYLVVAGGGGGGNYYYGGGGGAGGFLAGSEYAVTAQSYTITIGAGGAAQTNGQNSVFDTITAIGGGAGGSASGSGGGSGGGGGNSSSTYGEGTGGQGNNGAGGVTGVPNGGGGGGGAGAAGSCGSCGDPKGNGGNGAESSISGSAVYYAGGGGGGRNANSADHSEGGLGGGGNGGICGSENGGNGTANTGGGGGGGSGYCLGSAAGGSGGSGIVIIRYLNNTGYSTGQPYYIITADASQLDSSAWGAISSVSISQTTPANTNIKYLVSFDDRSTWKYWNGSSWSASSLDDLQTNGMAKTTLEGLSSSNWSASGGFLAGTTATIDFAADLSSSDSLATPELDNITVNYFTYTFDQALISSAFNTESEGNLIDGLSWNENSTLPTGTSITMYMRASSTSELLASTDWAEIASTTAAGYITSGCAKDSTTVTCASTVIPDGMKDAAGDQWMQYKIVLTSSGVNTQAISDITLIYVVNGPPDIQTVTASETTNNLVALSYEIKDTDTASGNLPPTGTRNYITPSFEYSLDNGSNWSAISTTTITFGAAPENGEVTDTNSDGNIDNKVLAGSFLTYTASWNALSTIPNTYAAQAKVRITANDNEAANNTASSTSAAFVLDTKNPTSPSVVVTASTTPASLAFSVSDDSSLQMKFAASESGLNSAEWQTYAATSTISLSAEPASVYVLFKDAYNNQSATTTATTPETPANAMAQDTSNIDTGEYRLFLAWKVVAGSFSRYEIYRSTDNITYAKIASIESIGENYYSDSTASSGILYYYKIATVDSSGNVSYLSAAVNGKANGAQDMGEGGGGIATLPVISNVATSSVSTAQATITWDTDTLSNSQALYTTSTGGDFSSSPIFGSATMANTAGGVGAHSITLTGLNPDTTYYFSVRSTDANDNTATSTSGANGYSFATLAGPIISAIATSSVSNTAAAISWTTNESSDSTVFYSTSAIFSNPIEISKNSDSTTSHTISLTGLTMGTNYYFYVKSGVATDNNGGSYYNFQTTADTAAPEISGAAAMASTTTATITWTTDELSDSKVQYGPTNSYGTESSGASLTLDHVIAISDLIAASTYHYRVVSMDANSNNATSTDYTFATADNVGPVISSVASSSVNLTGATITWTTNENADSLVDYGISVAALTSLAGQAGDSTTSHSVALSNLSANVKYYFRVRSRDAFGNLTTDNNSGEYYNFTTTTDTAAPAISNVSASPVYDTVAVITWETNELSDSAVQYGLTNSLGSEQTSATTTYLHSVALTGLTANTVYYYKALSDDASSNTASSSIGTFTTQETLTAETAVQAREAVARAAGEASAAAVPTTGGGVLYVTSSGSAIDRTAPIISAINVSSIKADSATVSWKTDKSGDSLVEYGLASNYSEAYGLRTATLNHRINLKNLFSDSEYNFKVSSIDANGNLAQSANQTFKTASALSALDAEAKKIKDIEQLANAQNKENVIASAAQTAMEIISQAAKQVSITSLESTLNNQYGFIEKLAQSIPAPILSGEPRVLTTAYTATVAWRTNKEANSLVAYSPEDSFKISSSGESFSQIVGNSDDRTTSHVVEINELKPDTTYIYQVRSKSPIGPSSQSANFTFRTQKEALEISSYVVQNVSNEKAVFKWITNVDTDAMLKYIPYRKNALAVDEAKIKTDKTLSLIHEIAVNDLEAGTVYQVEISGKDSKGDNTSTVIPTFATSNDDLPPIIYQVQSSSAINQGKNDTIQTVISWMTNESSTSKVYYAKGLGEDSDLLLSASQSDLGYTKKHIAVITKLEPGAIYRFMVESVDSTNNASASKVFTILTPRKQETVFDVIKKNFVDVFGWTSQVGK